MYRLILIISLVLYTTTTFGRGPATATGELALYIRTPRDTNGQTLFGKEFFADIHATKHSALFARAYHDEESWIATAGLETCLFNDALKIGIAGGGAGHDGDVKPAISPSIYYHTESTIALIMAEYQADGHSPFYRIYMQQRVWKNLSIGSYYDSDVGGGPSVGIKVTDHMKIWASIPLFERPPQEERSELLIITLIHF